MVSQLKSGGTGVRTQADWVYSPRAVSMHRGLLRQTQLPTLLGLNVCLLQAHPVSISIYIFNAKYRKLGQCRKEENAASRHSPASQREPLFMCNLRSPANHTPTHKVVLESSVF